MGQTHVRTGRYIVIALALAFASACPTQRGAPVADTAARTGIKSDAPATELFALRVRDAADTWRYYLFVARRGNEYVLRHGSVVARADKEDAAELQRARCEKLTRDLVPGEGEVVRAAAFTELSFRRAGDARLRHQRET